MTVKHLKTVRTLIEAMPWIRRFAGKVMVVQPDGVAAKSPRLRRDLAADVALLRMVGMQPLVVEGCDAAGGIGGLVAAEGARVAALEVTNTGMLPDDLLAELPAMLANEIVPVVAAGSKAALVAGALAAGVDAEKLVLMSDAGGLVVEQAHETVVLSECDLTTVGGLSAAGRVPGDLVDQLAAVRTALESGVGSAHIVDGRVEHALLLEILTDAGCGTKIVAVSPAMSGMVS
jgi:acetylglutamate kinase